ncbi:MAG: (2Fe-2S)-binding protein [Acidobacteria bacterium]|nr:(2Fe-2S)-binding protein [Acidobacteriota bacterium]
MKLPVEITVNGTRHRSEVEPRLLLVHYLRDVLDLTGTHVGCETGLCGACTILLDGEAVKSCMMLAVQANVRAVETVEGLSVEGELDAVQRGFWEEHGLQCGFCTPGMLLSAHDLLRRSPQPTEEEIQRSINGNLCRCTGYQTIVKAIQNAGDKMRAGKPSAASSSPSTRGRR